VGVTDYAAFVEMCRQRIFELGISYETVDALAGFPCRYTSKLMCGARTMSGHSMFTLLGALALTPVFYAKVDHPK
jgi:hypothetical protein